MGLMGAVFAVSDFTADGHPTDLAVRDLNGDGNLDIITVEDGEIKVYIGGTPSGNNLTFTGPIALSATDSNSAPLSFNKIAVDDFDGDGKLDIVGVGYRAELKAKQVVFALGYSHAVVFDIPQGIDVAIEKQTHLTVTGVDRQLVGQVAANIRRLRKPDPYKQKGVRYTGEVLKKKAGKTGAK